MKKTLESINTLQNTILMSPTLEIGNKKKERIKIKRG